jgi:hypothetical protein
MKRKQITIAVIILVAVAICVIVIAMSRSSASKPITFADAQQQAMNQQNLPNCLASSNQNIPSAARKDISSVVGAKLTDVPAGTAYGVFFNYYSNQKASGTVVYDDARHTFNDIGSTFNFAVTHSGNKWKLNSFNACNQH